VETVAPPDPPLDPHAASNGQGAGGTAGGAGHRRITPGRVAATIVVAGLLAMWVYAFSPWVVKDPPDTLDNDAFARQAQPVCAAAREQLDALPAARTATSPAQRATTVAQATTILGHMVDQLRPLAPQGASRDARITGLWLHDWETYLGDRRAYVVALQHGSTRPPTFTARGGESITVTIDNFAGVNRMLSCATPLDI
jgi:hypothetical protein